MDREALKPLQKLRTGLKWFFGLFLILFIYLDFFIKLESLYWLIGELLAFLLFVIVALIIKWIETESIRSIAVLVVFSLSSFGLLGYFEIDKYQYSHCQEEFGKEFNQRRRSLGIPEIPADWEMAYRGTHTTDWKKKDSIGHYLKTTGVDSACQIKYDLDKYNFKPYHSVSRSMSSQYRFGNGQQKDTMWFYYKVGDSTRSVTRKQADSIFAAEKIQKDY